MKEISLGRVVGSKIRNGILMPNDFTGWLDGDIFIHNEGQMIPYYVYQNKELHFLGHLRGQSGFTAKLETGYFSLYVAQENGILTDKTTGETIRLDKGDLVINSSDGQNFIYDEETGELFYETSNNLEFTKEEK